MQADIKDWKKVVKLQEDYPIKLLYKLNILALQVLALLIFLKNYKSYMAYYGYNFCKKQKPSEFQPGDPYPKQNCSPTSKLILEYTS